MPNKDILILIGIALILAVVVFLIMYTTSKSHEDLDIDISDTINHEKVRELERVKKEKYKQSFANIEIKNKFNINEDEDHMLVCTNCNYIGNKAKWIGSYITNEKSVKVEGFVEMDINTREWDITKLIPNNADECVGDAYCPICGKKEELN